jgi:hypothetical protein
MSNRHLAVVSDDVTPQEYNRAYNSSRTNKPSKRSSRVSNDESDSQDIAEVIQFCNSNRKDKNVRKDTKELLIEFLNAKYENYEPRKKMNGKKK